MKRLKITLLILISAMTTIASYSQPQFTQTVTTGNRGCNSVCSIIATSSFASAADPTAIIYITPAGGTANPHPIGAYFMYQNQWSVFNLDGVAIPVGAQFNVEYYQTDASHFVYIVPPRVHTNDLAYIDHAGLNNNPNAQIRAIPHITATIGNHWNKEPVKIEYDTAAAKWFIANINNTPISPDSAYNIIFSSPISVTNPNAGRDLGPNVAIPIPQDCHCPIPTSLPPNGPAAGDLGGNYPNPKVTGLQGRPLSNDQPKIGQVLKWGLAGWAPADEPAPPTSTSTPAPSAAKPSALHFNQSSTIRLDDPNVNAKSITGLDNQVFTLPQSSRIVFHTVIDTEIIDLGLVQGGATSIWLSVEILNASNAVVAKSFSHTWLALDALQSVNSAGFGILPAGTYHTRVSIHRQAGGRELVVFMETNGTRPTQGGQMILEIFPD